MAETNYTYSVASDLSAGVSVARLSEEINASAIATTLSYLTRDDDTLNIWFVDLISTGDETVLDGLVAAHSGLPLRDVVRVIGTAAFEPVVPGASRVVANDQPAIEINAGVTGFASAQTVWPYAMSSVANMSIRVSFIIKAAGTGSNVRLAVKMKCQSVGTDTSLGFNIEDFIIVPVNFTTIGEVFETTLMIATPDCSENDVVLLLVGRDGNNEMGAGANDDVTTAIQIIFIDAKVQ
jgi:hypothetical protein